MGTASYMVDASIEIKTTGTRAHGMVHLLQWAGNENSGAPDLIYRSLQPNLATHRGQCVSAYKPTDSAIAPLLEHARVLTVICLYSMLASLSQCCDSVLETLCNCKSSTPPSMTVEDSLCSTAYVQRGTCMSVLIYMLQREAVCNLASQHFTCCLHASTPLCLATTTRLLCETS